MNGKLALCAREFPKTEGEAHSVADAMYARLGTASTVMVAEYHVVRVISAPAPVALEDVLG